MNNEKYHHDDAEGAAWALVFIVCVAICVFGIFVYLALSTPKTITECNNAIKEQYGIDEAQLTAHTGEYCCAKIPMKTLNGDFVREERCVKK